MNPRFYFAACQSGAEKAVKAEVLAEHPELRFAFSRPGFVTFKEADDAGPVLLLRRTVFTRLWGEVAGQTRDPAALPELLAQIPPGATLQCFDRDQFVPGDEPEGFVSDGHIRGILAPFSLPLSGGRPNPGETVWSLVWVDDFHVFLTRHLHSKNLADTPGNRPPLVLPSHAPSRAWLKIEEAFYRFRPSFAEVLHVLEVGCAPGGATTALLDRGLAVTGIDPQNMAEQVASREGFTHVRKFARYVTSEDLRACNPDWLVMDMSIAPKDALAELAHVISVLRAVHGRELRIRHGFLTLKLNDWKYASEIPLYLRRLEQIGFHGLKPIQLASNRQEFFVWAPDFR